MISEGVVRKSKKEKQMLKTIKVHPETYAKIHEIAKANRRPFTTTLDIIVEHYMEEKCKNKENK